MRVVKSSKRKVWKIELSTHFLGIIPWKTYHQFCDGCGGGQGCSDWEFDCELDAITEMTQLKERNSFFEKEKYIESKEKFD